MFGYLRPYKPELKIKDFSIYKAVYCGLCHTLGKRYGFLSRMILSYDATLMCTLAMSLNEECCGFEKRRCPVNPHKKCDAARQNVTIDYWADVSVILGYYKVKDNIHDSGALKKAVSLLVLPFAKAFYKKALRNNPFAAQCAGEYIKAQTEAEQSKNTSVDAAAQPTAQLMASLLSHCALTESQTRVLERMGLFLGRWIYLSDAADDVQKDIKSGGFNPFAEKVKGGFKIQALAEPLLNSCIYEVTTAFDLLNIRRYNDILINAFYLGMPEVKKAVLSGLSNKEKKEHFKAVYGI